MTHHPKAAGHAVSSPSSPIRYYDDESDTLIPYSLGTDTGRDLSIESAILLRKYHISRTVDASREESEAVN